ncbi:hypothetical protein OJF2_58940 [Aquisphaera giovannonii]|uniref:Bacterial Ig-like domain (Group 2) n=1 Tax=Aquisphaera giovannonii TaxID=406548 RepID=A0A5B9WAL8_9BACT|nr:DUF1549 domain-containing protein [Aquisphaera giovannonii]QEH37304.1 hypothetical protein OJF2_58940 [Aquisphaera giovannonii]
MTPRRLVVPALLACPLWLTGCGGRVGTPPPASPAVADRPAGTESSARSAPKEAAAKSVPAATAGAATARPPLAITPEQITITADDPGMQLLVGEPIAGGAARDLSGRVAWKVDPPGAAEIEPGGYLRPLKAGSVTVVAEHEGRSATCRVSIEAREPRPWSFAEDIVPVLTRAGCNAGGCHGRADGQNGFHLSFLGYDPEGDFRAIVRDGAGRRVSAFRPEESLLLTRATGRSRHGGGLRVAEGSPEYRLLLGWLRAGAPMEQGKTHGPLEGLTVEPGPAPLDGPGPRQLRVMARYADGHARDVTRLAAYKVTDDSAAGVTSNGLASLLRRDEADVIVRYQSAVAVTRLSTAINPDIAFDFASLRPRNFIDEELFRRLAALRVPPSPPAADAAFLRRASLDLTGEQPTPQQVREFLADKDPEKRAKLVDRLLARPEFVLFWRIKLGDLLQISQARQGNGSYRYLEWIDRCLSENMPWDAMVTQLLTALGDPNEREKGGPVNYAVDPPDPTSQAELTAQRFLGLRMRCAQCHDHPFDVWTQDDYYGLAAFFARVGRGGTQPGAMMDGRMLVSLNPIGEVRHLRTGQPAAPRLPGGKRVDLANDADPRRELARWMTAADNPFFAKAAVNWAWAQMFGKGLVDPPDDMSRSNPAVHPELLDALAKHFVAGKFNLRDLVRTIAVSEAYGLSAATIHGNERDSRLFSHHVPRPLTAHQMADALAQATDVPNAYGQLGTRLAIRVSEPSTPSAVLDAFGRCTRATPCAPVQTPPLSLRQALLLIGGDTIDSKVSSLNGYLASAMKLELEPEELVESLYLRTVCRFPTAEESSRWSAELKQATNRGEVAEDLFWSLLSSREFAFNH